jgi:hypothetical protein
MAGHDNGEVSNIGWLFQTEDLALTKSVFADGGEMPVCGVNIHLTHMGLV